MNNQERKQTKIQQQQTSTFSNVPVQGMLQSYPFSVQSKPNNINQPDLKTSLMQAEKYGHHLNKTNLANQSATTAIQPKLDGQTVQLAKGKNSYPGQQAEDVPLGEENTWGQLQEERNKKANENKKMANAAAYVNPELDMGQIYAETSGGSSVVKKQWDHARDTESAQDYLKRTDMTPRHVANLHALAVLNPECGDGRAIGNALHDKNKYHRPTKHTLNTKKGRANLTEDDRNLRKKVGEEIPTEKQYASIDYTLKDKGKGRVLDADGLKPCVPDDRNLRIQAGLEGIPIEVRYPSDNKNNATMQSTTYEPNAKLGKDTKKRLYRGDEKQKNNDYEMMKNIHEEHLKNQKEKGNHFLDIDTFIRLWAHRARIKSADHFYDKDNNGKRIDRFEYPK